MSWRQSTSAMRTEAASSRAVNVDATEAEVRAICTKHNVAISAIETLLSGGTRVVMVNSARANRIRASFKSKLLTNDAQRTPWASAR
jgi:hypothetical protein